MEVGMEVGMEVIEDDVFFADLSHRISLLIMDDDDDQLPISHSPPVSFQEFSQAVRYPTTHSPAFYDENCRRETKGTGVFIPRSTQPRRKNRNGRYNSSNTRFNKQYDHHNSRPHQQYQQQHHQPHELVCNNNEINTSYNSFNHKRCQF